MDDISAARPSETARRNYEEWSPAYRVQHHFIGLINAIFNYALTLEPVATWVAERRVLRNVTPQNGEEKTE